MPNEAPYGHGCPPEPVAGKASKYRVHGPESAKAGGWAARPGDKVPQQGHIDPAAAKKVSLPKAAINLEDRKGPAPCRKNKGLAAAKRASLPKPATANKGNGTRRQPQKLAHRRWLILRRQPKPPPTEGGHRCIMPASKPQTTGPSHVDRRTRRKPHPP
jgi:hypothetical protein